MKNFIVACLLYVYGFRRSDNKLQAVKNTTDSAAKVGFGALGSSWVLSNLFGITLVGHSSGGAILTAGSGYIAGTYLSASFATAIWAVSGLLWFIVLPVGLLVYFRKRIGAALIWVGNSLSR